MFTSIKILLLICACVNVFLLTSINAKKPKTPGKNAEMCVSTSANTLNATADGDVCVKVLGQSGKIDFTFDTTTVQLTMDSIQEVDSSGNVVGNIGSTKHSFNSFASQAFTFSNLYSTTYSGIPASAVNFSALLVNGASNFKVVLYLFMADGTIYNRNQNFSVSRGSFKFSYDFDYSPFCTIGGIGNAQCIKGNSPQEGAFLDFTIIIESQVSQVNAKNDTTADRNTTALVYTDASTIYMPPDYYDSAAGWKVMPTGYPKFDIKGSQTIVTFRFSRFSASLDYDPILNWGNDKSSDSDTASLTLKVPAIIGIAIGAAVAAAVLFYVIKTYVMKPSAEADASNKGKYENPNQSPHNNVVEMMEAKGSRV